MRCLLDTHALIWWWLGDPSLSGPARSAMDADTNHLFVSAVSAYEIGNKVRRGQLPALRNPAEDFEHAVAQDGFTLLSVSAGHARHAGLMPGRHRDPFDRLIAAQALAEDLTVVTRDAEIAGFGCKVLW